MEKKTILNACIFDGKDIHESTGIVIKDGVLLNGVSEGNKISSEEFFLMPGLIDAHTHISFVNQLKKLRKNGVTGSCSISSPNYIKRKENYPKIWSPYSMAWGGTTNAKTYVENEISHGADYIKIMIDESTRMGFKTIKYNVLCDIVKYAHENNLKVAVHAVTVKSVEMTIKSNADILIHVPLKESIPMELIKQIRLQNMAVIPTLVMMRAFCKSFRFGFKNEDYHNAETSIHRLYSNKVPILTGTDSNNALFVPKINYGSSLHKEMELLVDAGMPPIEVLKSATSRVAEVFGIQGCGILMPEIKTDMILINGRPDKHISDIRNIKSIWIDSNNIDFSKGDYLG